MKMQKKHKPFINIDWNFYNSLPIDEVAELLGIEIDQKGWFLCPSASHNDTKPSAKYDPIKNCWKCFSCPGSTGGSALNLVMEHEQLECKDAALFLSKYYPEGVKYPNNISKEDDEIEIPILDMRFLKEVGITKNPFVTHIIQGDINIDEYKGYKKYKSFKEQKELWITHRDASEMLIEKLADFIRFCTQRKTDLIREFPDFDSNAINVINDTINKKITLASTNIIMLQDYLKQLEEVEEKEKNWQSEIDDMTVEEMEELEALLNGM